MQQTDQLTHYISITDTRQHIDSMHRQRNEVSIVIGRRTCAHYRPGIQQ